jgi:hypothetical protein
MEENKMKFLTSAAFILCLCAGLTKGQFKQGDWELGLVGSLGSMSVTSSSSFNSSYYSGSSSSDSKSYGYAIISLSPAFYIADGLSIEPEIGLTAIEEQSPAQFIIGNLSYTYFLHASKTALFARIGYGVSNSWLFTYNERAYNKQSSSLDIKLVNIGAGLKFLVTSSVILKSEINYLMQKYENKYSDSFYTSKEELNMNHVSLLFGFAILL